MLVFDISKYLGKYRISVYPTRRMISRINMSVCSSMRLDSIMRTSARCTSRCWEVNLPQDVHAAKKSARDAQAKIQWPPFRIPNLGGNVSGGISASVVPELSEREETLCACVKRS